MEKNVAIYLMIYFVSNWEAYNPIDFETLNLKLIYGMQVGLNVCVILLHGK